MKVATIKIGENIVTIERIAGGVIVINTGQPKVKAEDVKIHNLKVYNKYLMIDRT